MIVQQTAETKRGILLGAKGDSLLAYDHHEP